MFNKITIIGVGLIGGSIGLAVKKKKLAKQVVGVCRHRSSLRRARQKGAIDQGSLDYRIAVGNADLVILAAPIKQIINSGQQIVKHLKPGCLVTDTGSTKAEVVRSITRALPKGVYFVGAHPMAGSEKRGVAAARADLFQGALCILTPQPQTNSAALNRISKFWRQLGCKISQLSPQAHDQVVALISHLPHLAAGQLVKAGKAQLTFAASGFMDTTRIASSDAEIWSDICLTNKKFIIQAIDRYIARLRLIRSLISQEDKKRLSAEFKTAKALRDVLQK